MKLRERTGFRAVLGVLALLLGISGCTSSDDPTTSPSSTASGPASTSTTVEPSSRPTNVEPPTRPPAMDNPDEAGAVAAAEYFLRLTAYAAASGRVEELEAVSGEDCEACRKFVETPKSFHADGGWSNVPDVQIDETNSQKIQELPVQYQVELKATRSGYEYFTKDSGVTYVEAETLRMGFLVTFEGQWRVDFVQASTDQSGD